MFDVTDPANFATLSTFNIGESDSPHSRAGGRFGAHQFHEKRDGTLIYATWFSGGLRIIDVADPFMPAEVGTYIPEPPDGNPTPQSNDVFVDDQRIIYLADRNRGLDILEFEL